MKKIKILLIPFFVLILFSLNAQEKVEEKYDNGQIKEVGNIDKAGNKTGEWKFYYPNGQVSLTGNFENDKQTGEWKSYYENGQLYAIGNYENGKEIGKYKQYYENGQLSSTGKVENRKQTGEWIRYYDNGKLWQISNYKNGQIIGEFKAYNKNEELILIGNYENGEKTGEFIHYHENGKLSLTENYENGERTGELKYYHKNGKLGEIGAYENGGKTGEWKNYHENGKLKCLERFENDKETGEWKSYYENGALFVIGNYINGKVTGEWKWYYENGNLKEIGTYADDERTGEWKEYYEKGELKSIGNWENGEQIDKKESLDSIYILEKEPDMSVEIKSLPFEPDFAYVANNSLFFGEKENLKSVKIPIPGDVLSFTWSPDGNFIYFGVKTEVNSITKKVVDNLEHEYDVYDLKMYKYDLQKPYKAEYITTLYDRTNEYSEQDYFLDYGIPYFDMTCNEDTLIVGCMPAGGEGGFLSEYVVSLKEREVSLHYNEYFGCDEFDYSLLHQPIVSKFKLENKDGDLKVFYVLKEEETIERQILHKKEWKTLFDGNDDFEEYYKHGYNLDYYFEFSVSPNLNRLIFSAFTTGDMDVRKGKTYLSNLEYSTITEITDKVVLGGWFGEYEWLSNDNLLIHDTNHKELYIIETEKAQFEIIENVVTFKAVSFK